MSCRDTYDTGQTSGYYWIDRIEPLGFRLDGRLTVRAREFAICNSHWWNYFLRSGLVFRRD